MGLQSHFGEATSESQDHCSIGTQIDGHSRLEAPEFQARM